MERSLPNFAKDAFSTLRNSIFQAGPRSAYALMDEESENEEEISHSLFYSVHQNEDMGDSIPLTVSNAYSDRSQLLFEQQDDYAEEEESSENMHYSNQEDDDDDDNERAMRPSAIYAEETLPSNYAGPKPLSESLLPTSSSIPPGITSTISERKHKDPFFAMLFIGSASIFFLSGLIILFTTNSHAIEEYIKDSTFKTIRDCAGILTIMIATALIMGTIWLYVLRKFTRTIVWGTIIIVPISLCSMFLWTLIESLQTNFIYDGTTKENGKDTGLTIMSFIPFILSLVYTKLAFDNRHRISKTVSVIELACDVLRYNPGIILVSLLLIACFIAFSSIWIVFFNRLWLIGHLAGRNTLSGPTWIVNNYVYSIATFYIFFYMWTSTLFINLQRYILSSITAQWYFHRHEPTTSNSEIVWKSALVRGSTTSLGSLALGSLILTVVQFMQLACRLLRRYTKKARPFISIASWILVFLESFVSTINNYTISLVGITGESFFSAAKSGTKMFRRNLLSGLLGDLLTKLILSIGSIVISLSSGFGAYIFATHNLHSPHGFLVGLLATIMPLYISQFFSYTMMSIIDATFLCYAIDLDTGTVHVSAAHTVFSGFD
ncbi:hypothetical protein K501DRAFT_324963 [Backusella circina FSU 941]|nr:hypothetical protein K501DRAFT_324963 [Backusella circina FSU 941]